MSPDQSAADHVARFLTREVMEALLGGWTVHNERQARRWEASRPRPDDFLGGSDLDTARARWHRMTAVATAYRNRASIAPIDELSADLVTVFREEWAA